MPHSIPDAALERHIGILGKTGSGKSNTAKTIAERIMYAGGRVVIIDPTGTWWGIRLRPDGLKNSKFEPVIFGGNHADIPISGEHGALIAEAIATASSSAIIDTRLMTVGQRTRFFTAFAEALLRHNHGPLTLIIDEAHLFAPQGRVNDPQSGAMVGAANNLVSLGRGIGLRIVLISQRPAKLHKDSLSQVETLVAMRLIAPQDVRAIDDWIGEWADPGKGKEITASLPSLPTGTAWVWSPEIDILEKVKFPLATTFDSGKAPSIGDAGPSLTPIDVKAIGAKMETIRLDAAANDPVRLKRQIAELQKQIAAAPKAAADPAAIEAAEKRGYERGRAEGWAEGNAEGRALLAHVVVRELGSVRDAITGVLALPQLNEAGSIPASATKITVVDHLRSPNPAPAAPSPVRPLKRPDTIAPKTEVSGDLPASLQRALDSVAWWHSIGFGEVVRTRAAITAGLSPTASTFGVYVGKLVELGLLEVGTPGYIRATPEGMAAGRARADMTVLSMARDLLDAQPARVFDLVVAAYPEAISRGDLADSMGLSRTASTLGVYIGKVSRLGFIEPLPGSMVRAADFLFSGGRVP